MLQHGETGLKVASNKDEDCSIWIQNEPFNLGERGIWNLEKRL